MYTNYTYMQTLYVAKRVIMQAVFIKAAAGGGWLDAYDNSPLMSRAQNKSIIGRYSDRSLAN